MKWFKGYPLNSTLSLSLHSMKAKVLEMVQYSILEEVLLQPYM